MSKIKTALTIAGSDSGGGAGVQADLKTFQERDVFGTSVITALTAQNTLGVQGVYPQTLQCIEEQLDAVLSDIGADAVKTGMLFSSQIIQLIVGKLKQYKARKLVVDPVMYAKGGSALLQREAMDALKRQLLPLAHVITPNIPEACELTGMEKIVSQADIRDALGRLFALGPSYVLLKGGHLSEREAVDYLFDGEHIIELSAPRYNTRHTHGTGCTLSAAIAAELAKGRTIEASVQTAKDYITAAIAHAIPLGAGIGPTDHGAYRRLNS